jgi:hypothetical protein
MRDRVEESVRELEHPRLLRAGEEHGCYAQHDWGPAGSVRRRRGCGLLKSSRTDLAGPICP